MPDLGDGGRMSSLSTMSMLRSVAFTAASSSPSAAATTRARPAWLARKASRALGLEREGWGEGRRWKGQGISVRGKDADAVHVEGGVGRLKANMDLIYIYRSLAYKYVGGGYKGREVGDRDVLEAVELLLESRTEVFVLSTEGLEPSVGINWFFGFSSARFGLATWGASVRGD